jgi:hypothetical protein
VLLRPSGTLPAHAPLLTRRVTACLAEREMSVAIAPGQLSFAALGSLAPFSHAVDPAAVAKTISLRSTVIDLDLVLSPSTTGNQYLPVAAGIVHGAWGAIPWADVQKQPQHMLCMSCSTSTRCLAVAKRHRVFEHCTCIDARLWVAHAAPAR